MDLYNARSNQQAGFSLLEALIALVVFSIALLGLAAMYTKTLSVSHSTYLRALASIQAMDLEERIRANPAADDADYDFTCTLTEVAPGSVGGTPSNLASDDAQDWCANTRTMFGSLMQTADVSASASAPVDYTITLTWLERSIEQDNEQSVVSQSFTYTVRK